jgi:tetratricopeptide (TPR) repeat protein
MLLKLIIALTLVATVALAVIYHRPTALWIQGWQLQQNIDTLLQQRQWQPLYQLCQQAKAKYPNHAGVLKALAAYFTYYAHEPGQARPYYEALLKATPKDEGARLAFANLLRLRFQQPDKALDVLWQGTQLSPESTRLPYAMGNIYMTQAELLATQAQTPLSPVEQSRLLKLAQVYYQAVVARQARHYGAHFQLGRIASQQHEWLQAATHFCLCNQQAPRNYTAMFNLGYSFMGLGVEPQAHQLVRKAIDLAAETRNDPVLLSQLMQQANTMQQQLMPHTQQAHSSPPSKLMGAIDAATRNPKSADKLTWDQVDKKDWPSELVSCVQHL